MRWSSAHSSRAAPRVQCTTLDGLESLHAAANAAPCSTSHVLSESRPSSPQARLSHRQQAQAEALVHVLYRLKLVRMLDESSSTVLRCVACHELFSAGHSASLVCAAHAGCAPRLKSCSDDLHS